ncbi:6473_t:CDS:1 [Cetraspora pellucida]|uniref:6473_t:CDS:1 n=1 Tax=Cetraspora pellucida TaxID=1433469 RepID=A0A9N9JN22_9GLOM|nr:6473_t:CDS:1 [Cetraspora pellucida]
MDSVLVEGLKGYSNPDDNVDTAFKKIHEKNGKPRIVIDFENLYEACDRWKKKVYKFKALMNKTKRTAKCSETYSESRDQEPKSKKKEEIAEVTAYHARFLKVLC